MKSDRLSRGDALQVVRSVSVTVLLARMRGLVSQTLNRDLSQRAVGDFLDP